MDMLILKILKPGLRWAVPILLLTLALSACGKKEETPPATVPTYGPTVSLGLPDSLTGGQTTTTGMYTTMATGQGGGNCDFRGDAEPFRNGFTLTRFMVSAIASWGCLADNVMYMTSLAISQGWVQTDGTLLTLPPNPNDPNAPTGFWVLETGTQREVKLFWNSSANPGMYFAWDTAPDGTVTGKVVVDAAALNGSVLNTQPDFMRMDFSQTSTQKTGEIFIHFLNNPDVTAFRIKVTKNLTSTFPMYTAQGYYPMQRQWDANFSAAHPGSLTPALQVYAIADGNGHGAAVARMADWGWSFTPLDDGDHLGSFLFTKDDTVYFTNLGNGNYTPVFISKNISSASYLGDRLINTTGFVQSAAAIDWYFANGTDPGLPIPGYAANHQGMAYQTCTDPLNTLPYSGPECGYFLNSLFNLPGWAPEANSGSNPNDNRSTLIDAAVGVGSTAFFTTSCPADATSCTWDNNTTDGVFAVTFP